MARPIPKADVGPTVGEKTAATLAAVRAQVIRAARARIPAPTYEQIAVEAGCCVKTVWNVLHAKTHAH